MFRTYILILTLIICGCSTTHQRFPRDKDIFTIIAHGKPQVIKVDDEMRNKMQQLQTEKTLSTSKNSKLENTDRQWVLDLMSLKGILYQCTSMELIEVKQKPLNIEFIDNEQKVSPHQYHEEWIMNQCDSKFSIFIYDHYDNLMVSPQNPNKNTAP